MTKFKQFIMTQCAAAVTKPMYGDPHRCHKKHNLQTVTVNGKKVKICKHHVSTLERKGALELWNSMSFN